MTVSDLDPLVTGTQVGFVVVGFCPGGDGRLYLQIFGNLPTAEEAEAFAETKRQHPSFRHW